MHELVALVKSVSAFGSILTCETNSLLFRYQHPGISKSINNGGTNESYWGHFRLKRQAIQPISTDSSDQ